MAEAWSHLRCRRGVCTLLAAILDRRGAARGILIDALEVLEEAASFLRSCGLAERIECRAGDLSGELSVQADLYVLKWILHDWSDDARRDILSRVRATTRTERRWSRSTCSSSLADRTRSPQ